MQYIPNELAFGDDARTKVLKGAKTIGKAVGSTMGAKGRKVIFEDEFGVKVTMDGVSVAKLINLPDKYEQIGATLIKEAAIRTNEEAGDGTTTATVLAERLMEEGHKLVTAGYNPILLVRGMRKAKDEIQGHLKAAAKPVDEEKDFHSVAFISSRDEKIADVIAQVFKKLGKDGVVTVERGEGLDIEVEFTEGVEFSGGITTPYFINNDKKQNSIMEDCYVLVFDGKIREVPEILPLLQKIAKQETHPKRLVIIAQELTNNALSVVLTNNSPRVKDGQMVAPLMQVIHINPREFGPRRKEFLKDIAVITGGSVVTPEMGKMLKDVELADLGRAKKVVADMAITTIVEGAGTPEQLEGRVKEMNEQLEIADSPYERDRIRERLARIQNGVCVIKVGAPTEPAQIEKVDRVEDALGAARSAADEGIIAGGGAAFAHIALKVDATADTEDEAMGYKMTFRAIESCLESIVRNAGLDSGIILNNVQTAQDTSFGYDVMTGKLANMFEQKVIDPVKVQRLALENAVSVASMFLEMNTAVIFQSPEKQV